MVQSRLEKYYSGRRNGHRVLWSSDGLVFVTYDHYHTFYEIVIGKNGFAEKERHCGNHDEPKHHTNPHDHFIDWSNNFPDFHSRTNYYDNIPEFKSFTNLVVKGGKIVMQHSKYESVDEFITSIKYGKEVGICYKGVDYGIFLIDGIYYFGESKHEETEMSFSSVEDLLETDIQGKRLKDIITEVELWLRNI